VRERADASLDLLKPLRVPLADESASFSKNSPPGMNAQKDGPAMREVQRITTKNIFSVAVDSGHVAPLKEDALQYFRISKTLSFAADASIYAPGQPATSLFLVISGKVKVCRLLSSKRGVVFDVYQTDEFFGESALIEPHRSSSAIAMENTKVMSWTLDQVEAAGKENPRLLYALLQVMAKRLVLYEERIESFASEDVECRLARALIRLSEEHTNETKAARISPLTHTFLASYVGASREGVTHCMNRFRRLGYLSYSREGILVSLEEMYRLLSEEKSVTGR